MPDTINLDTLIKSCAQNKQTINRFEHSVDIGCEELKQSDLGEVSLKACHIPKRQTLAQPKS